MALKGIRGLRWRPSTVIYDTATNPQSVKNGRDLCTYLMPGGPQHPTYFNFRLSRLPPHHRCYPRHGLTSSRR